MIAVTLVSRHTGIPGASPTLSIQELYVRPDEGRPLARQQ